MVTIGDGLSRIVRLGVLDVDGVAVSSTGGRPSRPVASTPVPSARTSDVRVAQVRTMYRQLGIDPTKTRPSSEALRRRVRRGESLPRINTLVDVCNRCSLDTQLPYGLYDLEQVEGAVPLRVGQPGDEYDGIRKGVVHLAGRPALFDERGPFGNPTADSARTMVTDKTTHVLVVVFAPFAVPVADVREVLDLTASHVTDAAGGQETGRWVVEG